MNMRLKSCNFAKQQQSGLSFPPFWRGRKVGTTQSAILPNRKVFPLIREEQRVPQKITADSGVFAEDLSLRPFFAKASEGDGENVR